MTYNYAVATSVKSTADAGFVREVDTESEDYKNLRKAVYELAAKRERLTELIQYYDGDQPPVYLAARLRELFLRVGKRFQENWCAVVIDSCSDRIVLEEVQVTNNETAQKEINRLWRTLSLGVDADDAHEMALIASESFLIIGVDPEDDTSIVACYNDPRLCYVCYDQENPKRKKFAAKCWLDTDAREWRLTLYYPDRFVYYQAPAKSDDSTYILGRSTGVVFPGPDAFVLVPASAEYPAVNPWGVIPVFHFRNKRDRSDLDNVIPLQDGINKLIADMLVAAEFQALPQRYIITASDTENMKNAPGEIWELPAGEGPGQNTQAGQFAAADLSNFYSTVDNLVNAVSAISRTPKHFFVVTGGDPSGEALIAMEAPLNKKAKDRIERFIPEWRHAIAFLAQLAGLAVNVEDIEPVFSKPETVQPMTEAQVRQLDVSSGIPLKTTLRRSGWSEAELEQLDTDKQEADAASLEKMKAQAEVMPQQPAFGGVRAGFPGNNKQQGGGKNA